MSQNIHLLRLRKLLSAFSTPIGRSALRLGVAPTVDHRSALKLVQPSLVIDVGANRGQFALFARVQWPGARVVSLEPLAEAARVCGKVMQRDANFVLHQVAAGSETTTSVMNVTKSDDSSSLLPLGSEHALIYDSAVVSTCSVDIVRLDSLIDLSEVSGVTLLKIDTQGSELDVLTGAGKLLDRISHVYVELSFVELYLRQPLSSEVIAFLHNRGLFLRGVFNVSTDGSGRPVQADMLFSRADLSDPPRQA